MRLSIIPVTLLVAALGCTPSPKSDHDKEEHAAASTNEPSWKEMDEFHEVMADSFHPYMDSKDLGPAKQHAAHLAEVAEKWNAAPLPDAVNTPEVKAKLERLSISAKQYAELVNSNNDAAIGESLTNLHNLFHEIQDAWYHKGE